MPLRHTVTVLRACAIATLVAAPALGLAGTAAAAGPGGTAAVPASEEQLAPPIAGQVNGPCSGDRVGVDVNTGAQLACVYTPDGNVWVETDGIIVGVHESGESCNPETDRKAQTREGRIVTCITGPRSDGTGMWVYGA